MPAYLAQTAIHGLTADTAVPRTVPEVSLALAGTLDAVSTRPLALVRRSAERDRTIPPRSGRCEPA